MIRAFTTQHSQHYPPQLDQPHSPDEYHAYVVFRDHTIPHSRIDIRAPFCGMQLPGTSAALWFIGLPPPPLFHNTTVLWSTTRMPNCREEQTTIGGPWCRCACGNLHPSTSSPVSKSRQMGPAYFHITFPKGPHKRIHYRKHRLKVTLWFSEIWSGNPAHWVRF